MDISILRFSSHMGISDKMVFRSFHIMKDGME